MRWVAGPAATWQGLHVDGWWGKEPPGPNGLADGFAAAVTDLLGKATTDISYYAKISQSTS